MTGWRRLGRGLDKWYYHVAFFLSILAGIMISSRLNDEGNGPTFGLMVAISFGTLGLYILVTAVVLPDPDAKDDEPVD